MGDEGGLGRLGSGGTGVRTDFNRSAGVGLGARQLSSARRTRCFIVLYQMVDDFR